MLNVKIDCLELLVQIPSKKEKEAMFKKKNCKVKRHEKQI